MKTRDSNIELFRIILMLSIIAHHYVVNSGLAEMYDFSHISGNMIFLQFWGSGGKTAINCFMLISGYFMCKQEFNIKKFLKFYLLVKFYKILFFIIFNITGYAAFSWKELFKTVFNLAYSLNGDWLGGYIALFLISPFLNILIKHLTRNRYLLMIGVLLFIYTITATFFFNNNYEYLGWYATVYMIGAFLRIYPFRLFENRKLLGWLSALLLGLSGLSILVIDFMFSRLSPYYMFSDSNKLFGIIIAILLFTYTLNIKVNKSKLVNKIAESTLGILLIHANSDTMRKFLWQDIFRNTEYYNSKFLVIHAILTLIVVYFVCLLIDQLRILLIEKPLFSWIDNQWDKFSTSYGTIKERILCELDKLEK